MKRIFVVLLALVAVGSIAACSSSPTMTNTQTQTQSGGSTTINLSAQNLLFNLSTITVPHGATITVNFQNNDAGIQHNFSVYQSGSASTGNATGPIFVGKLISGVSSTTYTFTAPSTPGTYFFRCDVHPTMMTGTFIVS